MQPMYSHTCKIGISDDELNDYYDMATDDITIFDEQLRKMFDSGDDVIIV